MNVASKAYIDSQKSIKERAADTRSDFTDDLHAAFGFRTDYQIVTTKQMNKIIRATKSKK